MGKKVAGCFRVMGAKISAAKKMSQKRALISICLLYLSYIIIFSGFSGAQMVAFSEQEQKEKIIEVLASFLPAAIEGWRPRAPDELYTPETIFNYIDGAGEVYRSYGFRWLLVRRYEKEGQASIIVDFFMMGRSEDAFGVFTHDLEGERVAIGQDGLYKGGWLAFWKDRYYVSIYADQETPEIKKAIFILGQAIARSIPQEGKRPALLDWLPASVDRNRVHYFHTLPILNYHFFVMTDNWLELNETTEVALYRWAKTDGAKTCLLIISYPEAPTAQRAIRQFLRNYLPEADEAGLARLEDGFWTGAKVEGRVVIIVFEASSPEEIESLIGQVIEKVRRESVSKMG